MCDLNITDPDTLEVARQMRAAQIACRDDGGHVLELSHIVDGYDVLECVCCGAIIASPSVKWYGRSIAEAEQHDGVA